MDVISHLFVTWYKLHSARLEVSSGKYSDLPLDAFDGESISENMLSLEVEYRRLLCPVIRKILISKQVYKV